MDCINFNNSKKNTFYFLKIPQIVLPPLYLFVQISKITALIYYLTTLIKKYLKIRNPSIIYLFFAVFFILLVDIQHLLVVIFNEFFSVMSLVFTLQSFIFALILLIMFFDSFKMESVLTPKNVVILLIGFSTETGLIIMTILLTGLINSDEAVENFSANDIRIVAITGLLLLTSVILIIALIIKILRTINTHKKLATNQSTSKILKKIQIGAYFLIFGPIFAGFFSQIDLAHSQLNLGNLIESILTLFGIFLLIRNFFNGGMFIFQGENIKKLLIINSSGIPLYTYTFRVFSEENSLSKTTLQENDGEILFSGALKSISILLTEFTGGDKSVEGISLDGLEMMIENSSNDGYSTVLFVNNRSKFHRSALLQFHIKIGDLVRELGFGEVFNNNHVKIANSHLENIFGSRLDW